MSSWILLLVLSCLGVYCHADVVRAEFESCPACRLNSLPQVKRFLYKVVNKGHYPHVTVKWLHGRTPELVLYDEQDKEVERMFIDKLTFNDLHTLLQQKGFKSNEAATDSDEDSKDKPQLTTVLQQPTHDASSTDTVATTAGQGTARRALRGFATAAKFLNTLTDLPKSRSLDLDA